MTYNAAEGGRSGDNMNLRSFYTFGDLFLDGIRDAAQYNRETFNLEQIDVLRGAGAMLFGRGQAGGVINLVSKTPLRYDQHKLTGSIGTMGYRKATADLNKAFNPDTTLRANLMQRDEGSWRRASSLALTARSTSDPAEYDGGELVIEDHFGTQSVKLLAGDMILYPASSVHRVEPVTRGARVASFFWIESLVREDSQRQLLFDLDMSILGLRGSVGDTPEVVRLTGCFHNLLRMWADV